MKAFLMHPDRDFEAEPPSPKRPVRFAADIELNVLLDAAAAGDRYVFDIMAAACSGAWMNDLAKVRYRQEILKDCIANPSIVRQFYAIAIEPFGRERSWNFSLSGRDASSMVGSGVRTLQSCLEVLGRLRDACLTAAGRFSSQGFRQFFDTLERDLDDGYLEAARADLSNLTFRSGLLLSAQIGDGGKGVGTMLRKPQPRDLSWMRRALTPGGQSFTLQLAPRDEAGARAFGELQNRGLVLISDAVYQSGRTRSQPHKGIARGACLLCRLLKPQRTVRADWGINQLSRGKRPGPAVSMPKPARHLPRPDNAAPRRRK